VTWTSYSLYVILDIFSRYAPSWMVAPYESGRLAERLIAESCRRQGMNLVGSPSMRTVVVRCGPSR
jgi:transposase InsO family protein